ncbi:MAG: isoleucine--tRNA ligase [Firmicutes bacterium]|nr:isoleucine--tRNA ligase [Bacillota bacterium]
MYEKVTASMDFESREHEVLKFWKENDIFKKSIELRSGCPDFTFYDGPPTANGKPHIGHVITRVVKDLIPRYRTMKGYRVLRKAGWDTHGLPVELEVEKSLGISGKPDIEKYGIEPFIKKCKESVWQYKTEWEEMSERVGFWADMEHPYVTYDNNYIESEWWYLKSIFDRGLLYKGHKVVPYCPRCGTALSSHEVAQGYKDVKERSAIAKFKLREGDDQYILAWTTTPWTLPSNVALCVNANIDYVNIEYNGEKMILAKALVDSVLPEDAEYKVLEEMKGSDLENKRYYPLFDFTADDESGFRVLCDNYVTTSDGTGIVHMAPAFGEDDARVCNKYGMPFRQYVDTQGCFVDEVKPFAGMFVKDADPEIIKYMKQAGILFSAPLFEHSYPFCWRCDTHLLYYARDAWFIRMTDLRDNLVRNNRTVNWYPDNIKEGRFGNFLENVIDWSLSRERYWGTPLPIWECECGHRHAIGSIAELKEMSDNCPDEIELHKPYIDAVTIKCPKCGKQMKRVPEVIDCWFDSGSMPFAQLHYPFENQEEFKTHFPADFISEAVDQTRGWFYTLMAISTLNFDCAPFKNCIVLGHVQDKDGLKMSKHKGNVIDPWSVLNKQGADAVRWYFITSSAPWLPSRFYEEAVNESQRKFMGTFWNTYAFFVLYANIDNFNPKDYTLDYDKLPPMDRWILSKLNSLIKEVDEDLDAYKLTEPARAIEEFVDELSNWYVRRSRERFWGGGMTQDKINAYMTLYECLTKLSLICAPFVPFMTEEIYGNLVKSVDKDAPESIHLCDFPEVNEAWIDKQLEKDMDTVLNIVVDGRAARNTSNIKNRQPLAAMYVQTEALPQNMVDIIKDELNVKEVIFTLNIDEFTSYTVKPQLRTLGPRYGKMLPKISAYLKEADGGALVRELRANGFVAFDIEGTEIKLEESDMLIDVAQKEGFATETGTSGMAVILDTTLTDELIEEGFVREIISKVQTMRKEAGFEVLDRIHIFVKDNDKIAGIMARNAEDIKAGVLALDITEGSADGYSKSWSINGEDVTLEVKKD